MIDFDKFVAYSKPGPRYTSYPTALEFNESFNTDSYIQALKRNTNLPLSLYTHLPFCKSACYFCGCNVIYTNKENKKQLYIKYLQKELSILKNYIDTKREILQFHFGGGTPTFYDAKSLEIIINSINNVFGNFNNDAEISCEVDPRFFNENQMIVLKNANFNRLSFGVQDFDEEVQKAVNRIQPFSIIENAINLARKYGIQYINFDLIYGLPKQNLNKFKTTLQKVISLKPTRLAIFNYAHVPWIKKTMMKINENELPSIKEKLAILQYTINYLAENKYKMIGMDHFALEDDELYKASLNGELRRNFQGYSAKKHTQTIGLGITSIGEGEDYYVQNHKNYDTYMMMLDSDKLPISKGIKLDNDDIIRKNVIMNLMNNLKLDIKNIENRFHINFKEYFKDSINKLEEYINMDILVIDDNYIKVNHNGLFLIRNVAMAFDKYLLHNEMNNKRYSKTL